MLIHIIGAVLKRGGDTHESEEYIRASLRPDTKVAFSFVERGFPSIESELHGVVNGAGIVKLAQNARNGGADGIFVNCFDDPAVYACREFLDIPVFGGYQPAMLTAMALSERVGVLTTDSAGILSEERKARLSGFESRVACIKAVDMGVLDLMLESAELLSRLRGACKDLYHTHGVGAAILGCTGMHGIIRSLREAMSKDDCPITIIEPLQNGLKFLEHIIEQGYTNALRVLPGTVGWEE
jgi:allantoin racemase